jgi:transposase
VLTHDLTPPEKEALGGVANLVELADEVTEQWEWKPSCLYVIEHHQKKYLRRAARQDAVVFPPATAMPANILSVSSSPVIVAPKPPQAIPGGAAGPGLLAQVIVSKAEDHLPLHRQERIFERHGLFLSRQTTCDWWLACAELFAPLVELMRADVLASDVMHIDDTRVDIRDAQHKLQFQGHLWVRFGDEEHPGIVFDYTPDRSRAGPEQLLAGYRGYVQADAYSGYEGVYLASNGAILEVACWAHARRKFYEARRLDPRAQVALARIGQLYALEKELHESCAEEWRELPRGEQVARIAAQRQGQARPLLSAFNQWLTDESPRLLPQNPVRQAMEYLLNHWSAFCRYTDDGRLDIDNNEAERQMKHLAVGRKNWLFCASERGARAAAIHFSLIATCRRHKVQPWVYLRDLLVRLPLLRDRGQLPPEHLRPLLPHLWRPA